MNVRSHSVPVATDTIHADIPTIDNGSIADQFLILRYKWCAKRRRDSSSKRGTMDILISDRAQPIVSN